MATKTISITQKAYDRLKTKKENNESFSEVINRITNKSSIMELAGILTKKEGDKLEKYIKERRSAGRKRMNRIK